MGLFLDLIVRSLLIAWITHRIVRQCYANSRFAFLVSIPIGLAWWIGYFLTLLSLQAMTILFMWSAIFGSIGNRFSVILAIATGSTIWETGKYFLSTYRRTTGVIRTVRILRAIRSGPSLGAGNGRNAFIGLYIGLMLPIFFRCVLKTDRDDITFIGAMVCSSWLGAFSLEAIGRASNRREALQLCAIGGSLALCLIFLLILLPSIGVLSLSGFAIETLRILQMQFVWSLSLLSAAVTISCVENETV